MEERKNKKEYIKHFTFTIDSREDKYKDLIELLEKIDNGSRSFVIRQLLNKHLNEMEV